jgi:hypothetical protein
MLRMAKPPRHLFPGNLLSGPVALLAAKQAKGQVYAGFPVAQMADQPSHSLLHSHPPNQVFFGGGLDQCLREAVGLPFLRFLLGQRLLTSTGSQDLLHNRSGHPGDAGDDLRGRIAYPGLGKLCDRFPHPAHLATRPVTQTLAHDPLVHRGPYIMTSEGPERSAAGLIATIRLQHANPSPLNQILHLDVEADSQGICHLPDTPFKGIPAHRYLLIRFAPS